MQVSSGQMTESALRALIENGALAGEWVLDLRSSSIRLKTRSLGLRVSGVFDQVSGHGTVSADGTVSGTITVAAASVNTHVTRRDEHLRSADIFDADNYPDISFSVEGVRPSGRGVAMTGALTVRGRTRPLSFNALTSFPNDGEVCLDTQVRINRADFDLTWKGHGLAAKTSTLAIHAVFIRPITGPSN
jgi:polyisoprenoid-binding protein YceI